MQLLNKLFSWMRNFETVVDWYLSVSEDCYRFQGSLFWMMKLLNSISSHTPPLKYGLLGIFPLLLCGLSKSLLPIWLCAPKHRHLSIQTDMHAGRGDSYTQLFLICTWLLLWLNFEKKGHVIRNFHSSKHKRVQLVSEGSRLFSDAFRKSVNGRNIVQQSRKVKTLSFSVKRNFVSILERPLLFSVKRIFVQFWFFGQALLLERQVFGTTWVFLGLFVWINYVPNFTWNEIRWLQKPHWIKDSTVLRQVLLSIVLTRHRSKKSACSFWMHIVYVRCWCTASNWSPLLVSRSCQLKP
jgi:hypothetical protein